MSKLWQEIKNSLIELDQYSKKKLIHKFHHHICYSDPKRDNNISKTSKGKPKPEGFGVQQSIRLSGKKRSEETKAKMKKQHATYKNRIGKPRGKYKKTQLWETNQNL